MPRQRFEMVFPNGNLAHPGCKRVVPGFARANMDALIVENKLDLITPTDSQTLTHRPGQGDLALAAHRRPEYLHAASLPINTEVTGS